MIVTLRDPSLYHRLTSQLPRPDAPIDYVLRRLIEQPCKLDPAELIAELLERGVRKALLAARG